MTTPDVVAPSRPGDDRSEAPTPGGTRSRGRPRHAAAPARRWRRRPTRQRAPLGRRLAPLALAAAVYLALSVLLWWQAWSSHPTATSICACGDPALFLWFLEWPAHALAHGENPFASGLLFHPQGINLLSNTSVLAIGLPLAPVTWLFGPVATLNVASTLSPALSALAMFWLLRRYVDWAPAAFVGGLLYGFSPFMLASLAYGHLMTSMLVVPPLVAACLDELLLRHRHRPVPVGVALGVLLAVEFFISTEMLVITVMTGVLAIALMAVFAAVRRRHELAPHVRAAAPGLGTAVVVGGGLLAYPAWYALAGPAHLASPIWTGLIHKSGAVGSSFVRAFGPHTALNIQAFGGYQGPALPSASYVGVLLPVVLAAGLVAWRRDVRLWFFAVLGAVAAVLSLNIDKDPHHWVPWQLVRHLPLMENVIQERFTVVVYFSAAVMLAVILDRTRRAALARVGTAPVRIGRWLAGASALAVALVALAPIGSAEAGSVPLTMTPVAAPPWFTTVGANLTPGTVVLVYPFPASGVQTAMTWQALGHLRFAQVGGGGPQSELRRVTEGKLGYAVLQRLSFGFRAAPGPSPANLHGVRRDLELWGVQLVVIPGDVPHTGTLAGRDARYAAAFMTAALGRAPVIEQGAWVWPDVSRSDGPAPLRVPGATLGVCSGGAPSDAPADQSVPACVLRAAVGAGVSGPPTSGAPPPGPS